MLQNRCLEIIKNQGWTNFLLAARFFGLPIGHAKTELLKTKVHVLNTTRNVGFRSLLLNITYAIQLQTFLMFFHQKFMLVA